MKKKTVNVNIFFSNQNVYFKTLFERINASNHITMIFGIISDHSKNILN